MRVLWALHELGLDYAHRPIGARTGETQLDAYGRINPKRKIPSLEDGDLVMTESAAIARHLFRAYGEGRDVFVPSTEAARAREDEWCFWAMTELDAHSLYAIRRHKFLAHIYGEAPEAVASAGEYCRKQLDAMAPRIAAASPYLFGERIGVADILLGTCLDWAVNYEVGIPDSCSPYLERLKARPAYKAATEVNVLPQPSS